jgi:hypothetical protein
METRTIRINIEQEPELHKELEYALVTHSKYQGCYIMQYMEHRNDEYQLVGEYMLREAGEELAGDSDT